jgi:hypothetical protein
MEALMHLIIKIKNDLTSYAICIYLYPIQSFILFRLIAENQKT